MVNEVIYVNLAGKYFIIFNDEDAVLFKLNNKS